jgi:hypothetical protein
MNLDDERGRQCRVGPAASTGGGQSCVNGLQVV